MTDKDIEWMVLVTYARAAGATSVQQAEEWVRIAIAEGVAPFEAMTSRIDREAAR